MPEQKMEELFTLVSELKSQVKEMAAGKVDEAGVRTLVNEAMAASRRAGSPLPQGFVPPDVDEANIESLPTRGKLSRLTGAERFMFILNADAERIAPLLRKTTDQVRAFQQASDELTLLAAMTKSRPEELDYFHDVFVPLRDQAMDTKTTGEGKEYVADAALSTDLLTKLEGQLQILALFPSITMPTNPFDFPVKGPRKHVAVLPEALEPGVPKAKKLIPGTPSRVSLAATKFAGEIVTSKELEEDAAIAMLPFLQSELLDWLTWDLEDASLNGDKDPPHMDAGVAADDPKTGWDGLRKFAKANGDEYDAGGGPFGLNTALQTRAKMGRYGLSSAGIIWIVSVPSLYALLAEDKLTTVDQYGPGATILTGEIGRLWGSPVISTDLIATTMDANGVIPAAPGNLTIAIAVNPSWFIHGVRRNTTVQILTELYAESDQDAVLVTTRQAFAERYAGEPAVAVARNIDTTIPQIP
jgi:hypothetical protein